MAVTSDRRPRHPQRPQQHRIERMRSRALRPPGSSRTQEGSPPRNVSLDCGWGRLHFAQTFEDSRRLTRALQEERPDRRDIAFYVADPHVVLSQAPQDVFLDPSHTYRLDLHTYRPGRARPPGFHIRRLCTLADAEAVNRIYAAWNMVQVDPQFFWSKRDSRALTVFVAEDDSTGDILGAVTGVDHRRVFEDPEGGSSLWCLAVDPQAQHARLGEALVRQLAEHFQTRGCHYMDLSVLHDNTNAIALYEKLGFVRVPVFALKNRNSINEKLFSGPPPEETLNPYARIIVDEARRRGISVEVLDAEAGYFRLSHGGRSVVCRESLSELTTAIAMSRCDDKAVTRRLLAKAGLSVPRQQPAGDAGTNARFLEACGSVVVKPARGEQGRGISVDVHDAEQVEAAIEAARRVDDQVLLEEFVVGQDLRIIVIDFRVVAAAVRRPPQVRGTGQHTVRELIERQSRRRQAATGGESRIPVDAETARCLAREGLDLDSVPEEGRSLEVRRTANLHTGGTIHDVTEQLGLPLVEAAVRAARALDIPVVGLDFIAPDPAGGDYWIIEANERPGLANHEPQPTAERFVDLLFPQSVPTHLRKYQGSHL
jgi:GNAT-family acetyltransferase (TIGR03103 family)